ncbi:MAG TPA: 16S rRNA (guanine(527)-N(7))-methyltransferase RsmG, partial [Actinotalea sp.]|nr:16S rRNA (guanine(527)-N(7))-methyltransferase RsmG [Actinotalea sp.]
MATTDAASREPARHDPLQDDPAVVAWLGDAFPLLRRFGELLADEGLVRGLIGPREVPRLWERHLLNCAAVAAHVPAGVVADVGSGAGLPGVVVAALRPDVRVVLVEPMARRVAWLETVVRELGLDTEVARARAEDLHGRLLVDGVTARAVAPLDRLATWTLPLLRESGELLALKGESASEELRAARPALRALGGDDGEVLEASTVDGVAPTRLVRVRPVAPAGPA